MFRALSLAATAVVVFATFGSAAVAAESVVVLAVPDAIGGEPSGGTTELAAAVARQLRAGGLDVLVVGTQSEPLEELVGRANVSPAALVVGVRSKSGMRQCGIAMVPSAPPRAAASDRQELGDIVRGLAAESRAQASLEFRRELVAEGRWCDGPPRAAERYLLRGLVAPAVFIAITSAQAAAIIPRLPALVSKWLASERERGRRTSG